MVRCAVAPFPGSRNACPAWLLGLTLLLLQGRATASDVAAQRKQCEPLTIPLCMNLHYNETIMPNFQLQEIQEEAGLEVHQFSPLVQIKCSPDFQFFLCSVYAPICNILHRAVPPCRSLCESARNGCENIMLRFGMNWPTSLNCEKYPDASTGGVCVGEKSNHIIGLPLSMEMASGEQSRKTLGNYALLNVDKHGNIVTPNPLENQIWRYAEDLWLTGSAFLMILM